MDVEQKVDLILSRKTFSSEALRERTREALLKTLRPVEAIRAFDDDAAFENQPSEIRYDESDGVPLTTAEALETAQDEKKASLRKQAKLMFTDGEFVPDGNISTVVNEDTDINRKLKWGYTLLHFAAVAGDDAECERLISLGASKSAQDNGGKLPWQKAELSGYEALAIKLRP